MLPLQPPRRHVRAAHGGLPGGRAPLRHGRSQDRLPELRHRARPRRTRRYLLVLNPNYGRLQILHAPDDTVASDLMDGEPGVRGSVTIHDIVIDFVAQEEAKENEKAGALFHFLTDLYMVFRGPVVFSGVNADDLLDFLRSADA